MARAKTLTLGRKRAAPLWRKAGYVRRRQAIRPERLPWDTSPGPWNLRACPSCCNHYPGVREGGRGNNPSILGKPRTFWESWGLKEWLGKVTKAFHEE